MGRERENSKIVGESSNGNLQKKKMKIFLTRKKGLVKKFRELKTLCDIEGCMILVRPNGECDSTVPENRTDVEEILKRYNGINPVEREKRKLDLSNFFDVDEKPIIKKIKFINNGEEKTEVDRKLMQKYPAWDERLDGLTKESLKDFENRLESMMEVMSKRERMLKNEKNLLINQVQQPLLPSGPTSHGPPVVSDDSMMMGGCVLGIPCDPSLLRSMGDVYSCGCDQYYHHQMMMVMNNNGFHQQQQWVDGPGSTTTEAQMAPMSSSVSDTDKFYDQMMKLDSRMNNDFAMIGRLNYCGAMGMMSTGF